MTQKTADQEIRRLQGSINDLISIQALPAIWNGRESGHIASTLLDVLVSMLRLDFAYARLSDSINGSPVEFVRSTQRRTAPPQPQEIGRALDRWLTNQSANAPLAVPNPAGDGEVRIAPLRLGLMDEIGMLVAARSGPIFRRRPKRFCCGWRRIRRWSPCRKPGNCTSRIAPRRNSNVASRTGPHN